MIGSWLHQASHQHFEAFRLPDLYNHFWFAMDISIIIPTRHRPQNIDRIIAETKGSLGRQFEMVLGIDEDDENYDIERLKKIEGVKKYHPSFVVK